MRGLLLDFGSVISVSLFERQRETEQRLGLRAGSLTWLGPLDPSTDALWRVLQSEEISEREYWARRAAELGALVNEPGWSMLDLLKRLTPEDPNAVVRPEMAGLIRDARRCGLQVGVLSNELELFYGPAFVAGLHVLRDMTAIVDATHTGVLKPDARAFESALKALDLPAHEVLFVDDQFRNIAGAVRAGLQTQFFDLRDVAGNIAAIRSRLRLSPEQGVP
jgi:putative hydrolase of the HAD superfamily